MFAFAACPIDVAAQGRRAAADDPGRDRALELFESSTVAYREGRFSEAASMLREAYALHAEPVLLYNLARALEADGQLDDARDAYREFLELSPDAEQAAPSRRRLEVIEGLIAEREAREVEDAEEAAEEAAVEEAITTPPPAETPRTGPDTLAPWLVLSASALVLGTGGVLLGVASSRHRDAANATVHLTAAQLEREAYALRDSGAVIFAIGGAATIASAIWLVIASLEPGPTAETATLRVSPFGLELSGTF